MKDKPTEKQLKYIEAIEEYTKAPLFEGTTKQEASKYISKHKDMLDLMTTSTWVIENGYF